ncbi:MAG TPA: RidA family protein [Candidatus Dormibacteraeota bacterium]|nr:RidA family protein [Candidatus Dormibacteraeota bacterium]
MSQESTDPHRRLRELGVELPAAPAPAASYVQTRLVPLGDRRALLYVAGQISREGDRLLTGRCPDEVPVEEAARRARVCAINVLSQIHAAVGLEKVEQLTQVMGWVLSSEGFGEQPKVMNGASDFLVEVLGDAGKHTRAALGTNALPFSVTVELAAVAIVRTS